MRKLKSEDSQRATIHDVARFADVSIKTVSRVANGLPNVREQTRIRVQSAIVQLNYTANPYALHLSSLRWQENIEDSALPMNKPDASTESSKADIDWW